MNPRAQPPPERRQVTVLFCDLVDSSGLVERLDPEETHGLMLEYQNACAAAIEAEGGQIYRFAGDGVVARFGYPVSSEDNAERAVRAALAASKRVGRISLPPEASRERLECRAGIATGVAVVSELRGTTRDNVVVVGEAPTLAARLQEYAPPGGVVVCETTWMHAAPRLEGESLGTPELKGIRRSLEAYLVVSVSDEAMPGRHWEQTTLVGREAELETLRGRWRAACDGRGAAVRISGEPGVGKSTLVSALRQLIGNESCEVYAHYGSRRRFDTQLFPIRRELRWRAGSPDTKTGAVEQRFAQVLKTEFDAEDAARDALLDLLLPGRAPHSNSREMSPEARRERMLGMLTVRLLGAGIGGTPKLVIFEDLQWMDPTTISLIERLVFQCHSARALIVLTSRADAPLPDGITEHSEALPLAQLDETDARELVRRSCGDLELPAPTVDTIIERTDGVPLFIEELTREVVAAQQRRAEAAGTTRERAAPEVPSTLRDALSARLDRTPDARYMAQVAAVAGRYFDKALLFEVLDEPTKEKEASLAALVEAGIVQPGDDDTEQYNFKHGLVQELAYETLLRQTRKDVHQLIATALENRGADMYFTHPQELAHHWSNGEEPIKASRYRLEAGRKAIRQSAHREAQQNLDAALKELERVPPEARDHELELAVLTTLGPSLIATEGYLSKQAADVYERADQLEREVSDAGQRARVLRGKWTYNQVSGQLEVAARAAAELESLGTRRDDRAILCEANRIAAQTALFRGQHAQADVLLKQAMELYDPGSSGDSAARFGNDTLAVILSYSAWNAWFLGHPQQCETLFERAITRAHEAGHPFSVAQVLTDSIHGFLLRRDFPRAEQQALTTSGYAAAQAFPYWRLISEFCRTWANNWQRPAAPACEDLQVKLSLYAAYGVLALPWFHTMLGGALLRVGQEEACLAETDKALEVAHRSGEYLTVPETLRVRAVALRKRNPDEAITCLEEALDLARRNGAIAWELRSAASLARLSRGRAGHQASLNRLADVVERLPGAHRSSDLDDATALLAQR